MPNADRTSLDDHPYICFDAQSDAPMSSYAQTPCNTWASSFNTSMGAFGLTTAGEFSNAVTDCGLWVNGVGLGTRYEGNYTGTWPVIGSCTPWTDWQSWDATMKTGIMNFAMASMDALPVRVFSLVPELHVTDLHDRIGSFGLGRLVLLPLAVSSNRPNGRILWGYKMAGCPLTPAQLPEYVPIRVSGVRHFRPGKLAEQVLVRSRLPSVRISPGHPAPLATLER